MMRVAVLLLITAVPGACCTVIPYTVKDAVKKAEIVFRGTITEVRDSEIVFRVETVWKGRVPPTFSMPKVVFESPCHGGFSAGDIRVGAELLVFAHRIYGTELLSDSAMGSRPVQFAAETLKKLGRGHPPR